MLASSKKKLKDFFPISQSSPNHLQVLTDKDEPYIPSSNSIKTYLRLCPTDDPYPLYQIIEDTTKLKVTYQSEDNINSSFLKNNFKSNSKSNTSSKRNQQILEYKFTKIFDCSSTNNDIFNEVTLPLIEDLLSRNKSSLLFTYGISGSGKSYTINGDESSPGLLPLAITLVFIKLLDMENPPNLSCNYIEIYNECVYDLFSSTKNKLQIKEKHKTFYLDNCTNIEVTSIDEFETILNEAALRKKINKTLLNDSSSRSHTIFKIMLSTGASMSIVDLAGAERSKRADTKGIEFQETCNINTSLMTLGRCIDAMETNSKYIQPEKKIPVPIRESKLTKLFQEYFTGEQNVIMISTVKMSNDKNDIQENKNVLAFACKAKRVTPIRSWICNSNTNRKMKMLIASESKQKEKKECQSDISSDGENEINSVMQSRYQQLIDYYEKNEDEIINLQEDNAILIQKLKLLEKEYATREYNTIVSKGRDFLNDTYKALTSMDVNQYYQDNSPEIFIFKNPLYKKYKEDEVNVLTKENSFTVAAKERKAFKAIVESFTIESTNATALSESELNYQIPKKKKKKKTKKKESNNDDTIQEIDEDYESTIRKKKKTKSKPKKSKKTLNEDSEDEVVSTKKKYNSDIEDEEEFEYKKGKKKTKRKGKKSKKNTSYIEEESNNESSPIEMSPIQEEIKSKKKRKKERIESDFTDELSSSNENNDSDDSIHISAIKRSYAEALKNKRRTKKKTKGKKGTKSKK